MADKDNQYRVLAAVQKGTGRKNLKKGQGTIDRSGLPRRSEMVRQTKAEKEAVEEESAHDAVIEDITSGEHARKLKKTDTVDKTQRSKEQLGELLKQEQDSYKQGEQQDRAAVLADVTKGDKKLKKTDVVDKSALPDKKELASQIKDEKQAQAIDDAHSKVLADVSKGGEKKKVEKNQNTRQIKKEKKRNCC